MRNALLGLHGTDIDLSGTATPQRVTEVLLGHTDYRVIPRAVSLGTVEIHIASHDGVKICEYTAFRSESYRGGVHRPSRVAFTRDIASDAVRRDLTVNALYADCADGEIVDCVDGLSDLRGKLLRAAMPDPNDTFANDGLRILRLIRFASELDFDIEEKTLGAAVGNIGLLADISGERIRDEFLKILLADAAYPELDLSPRRSAGKGLNLLIMTGAMRYCFPELLKGAGAAQRSDFHAYDVLRHNIEVCLACPPDITLRLAGLAHDVGKPYSMERYGMNRCHADISEEIAVRRLGRSGLKMDNATVDNVARLIRYHMLDKTEEISLIKLKRHMSEWGEVFTRQLMTLKEADTVGGGLGGHWRGRDRWNACLETMIADGSINGLGCLAVNGDDVMAVTGLRGAAVGKALNEMFEYVLAYPERNTREYLLGRLEEMKNRTETK